MAGRWKMGPNGGYWDGQDDGPDQMTPTPEMMAQAGQGPVAAVPPSGQGGGFQMPENGGFTGGIDVMRQQWEATHPGQPFPGLGYEMMPGTDFPVRKGGGPISIMPTDGEQWTINGGQPYDFPSMLEALRTQFGGQKPLGGAMPGAMGGGAMGGAITGAMGGGAKTGGSIGGALGGAIGGLFGHKRAPQTGGALGAPQQSLTSLFKRNPNDTMNLGALGAS